MFPPPGSFFPPFPGSGMGMPPGPPNPGMFQLQQGFRPPKQGADREQERPSVFYKTRICHNWKEGNCHYGDKCKYAHGEVELRPVPPEMAGLLDRERDEQRGPGPGDSGPRDRGPAEVDNRNREAMKKTRLCDKFMMTGKCPYGDRCTFAHGYDELRQVGTGGSRGQPAGGGPPGHPPFRPPGGPPPFGNPPPGIPQGEAPPDGPRSGHGRGGAIMRPYPNHGAPMGPGAGGYLGDRGPPPQGPPLGAKPPASVAPGPSPPGAPPLSKAPPGAAAPPQKSEITYLDRVRAICGILNIGNAANISKEKPQAVHAAVQSMRTGAAFRENPYADSVDCYLPVKKPS